MDTSLARLSWQIIISFMTVSVLISGCGQQSTTPFVHNNFEQYEGWTITLPGALTSEKSHSGQWATKTDRGVEFSMGFTSLLSDWGEDRTARLRAWVWLPHGRLPLVWIVVKVMRDGVEVHHQNLHLEQVVTRYRQWELVSLRLTFPADLLPSDKVQLFMWQPVQGNAEAVYMDDLVIEAPSSVFAY